MLMRKRGQIDPKTLRKKVDTPLAKSIREEIKRLADDDNFTLGTLHAIERVAAHGRAMLQGTADLDGLLGSPGQGVGAIGYDTDIDGLENDLMASYSGGPMLTSSPVENFGSRAMREVMAVLPKILEGRNRPSTVELVRSLALARKEGLDDVAKDLEQQIKGVTAAPEPTVAKPLGEMPRKLPNGAYYKPSATVPGGGVYVERNDPEWRIEEYNDFTGESAKATDFPAVVVAPPPAPEIGGAA